MLFKTYIIVAVCSQENCTVFISAMSCELMLLVRVWKRWKHATPATLANYNHHF